jgi:hypothetical protein
MALLLGAAGALLLPLVMLLVLFALSDNADDHAFRVLKPARVIPQASDIHQKAA